MKEIMAYEVNNGAVFREKEDALNYENIVYASQIIKNTMPKSFNERIENGDKLLAAIVVHYKKEVKEILEILK